ncbi:MAG: hypothetical protein AB7S38_02025 [Vulcanimicrobiota bacterium]
MVVSLAERFAEDCREVLAELALTRHRLVIANLTVELALAEPLTAKLLPALAHHASGGAQADFTIFAWHGAQAPLPSPPWRPQSFGPRARIEDMSDARFLTVFEGEEQLLRMIDLETGHGFYWAPAAERLPYYELAAPFRVIFSRLLGSRSKCMLHAAAVGRAGVAVLLPGRGGSGKSNLALASLEAGLEFVGEDYCLVDIEQLLVHGLYCSAKLHRHDLPHFPWFEPMNSDQEPKAVTFLARSQGHRLADGLGLRAIVMPQLGQKDVLTPVTPAQALLALAPSTVFQLPGDSQATFAALARLSRRLPCYRLELATRAGGAEKLRELLE